MPIQLHERLSEFSYGYGVTREFEGMLTAAGLAAVPFMPNLIHEAKLGFDVGFNRPGKPLLIQFKLGQALRRFVPGPRPNLDQPFWRFRIDTAEPDGQYELLLKAEIDGAEVYYAAPKFHDWEIYLKAFETQKVVRRSLLVTPLTIRKTMDKHAVPDGEHTIVYDKKRAYLCSDPHPVQTVDANDIAANFRAHIDERHQTLAETLDQVYRGFSERQAIRRERPRSRGQDRERTGYAISSDRGEQSRLRADRLNRLRQRARTEEDALALAVGAEAWSLGTQLILVTEK
jgi:hypothetical protein